MKILTYMLSNKIALVNQPIFRKNEVKNNCPVFLFFSCFTIDNIVLRSGTEITEYSSIILLSIGQLEVGVKIEFYLSCGTS